MPLSSGKARAHAIASSSARLSFRDCSVGHHIPRWFLTDVSVKSCLRQQSAPARQRRCAAAQARRSCGMGAELGLHPGLVATPAPFPYTMKGELITRQSVRRENWPLRRETGVVAGGLIGSHLASLAETRGKHAN